MHDWITATTATLQTAGEVYLRVKIHPKARSTGVYDLLEDGTVKIHIREVPEKGKANKALAKYLGDLFNIPKQHVTIISGHTDPVKLIKLST